MTIKVGINGMGRIGRMIVRSIYENHKGKIIIKHINNRSNSEICANLLKYDSIHGNFSSLVKSGKNYIKINKEKISYSQHTTINDINWKKYDVDYVFECTGKFNSKDKLEPHLNNGAKKVIVSAPCKNADKTIVFGVNESELNKEDEIISAASCTTNCLAPVAHVLNENFGIEKERILIKIAATWEGIKAAEILEKEGIKCNLTLLFNFCQAVTCANAKITLISPFVGRILDWHKAKTGKTSFVGAEDPGVISVTQIYKYFKEKGFTTEVMGASFRNLDEIKELAGCDLLTIAPKFLEELKKEKGELVRKLDVSTQINNSFDYEFEEKDFRLSMLEDQMASEKLSEGITGFSKAIEELEQLLLKRFSEINNQKLISAN